MITSKNRRTASARRPISQTEKNGLRAKRAEGEWKQLLEMRGFAPIKNKSVRRNTAMLLENQWRHLNEASTTSSIFGPANGATAGALHASDSYATGDNRLPRVLLPMVRRIYPALMSNETVGVQPMPGPVAMAFAIRYRYLRGSHAAGDSAVNHVHKTLEQGAVTDSVRPHGIKGVDTVVVIEGTGEKHADGVTPLVDVTLVDHMRDSQGNVYPQVIKGVKVMKVLKADGAAVDFAVLDPLGYKLTTDEATTLETAQAKVYKKVVGSSDTYEQGTRTAAQQAAYTEMGYQKLDTRFTGRADSRLGEVLANGRWKFRPEDTGIAAHMQQFEGTGAVARTTFGFEKTAVEAGTRRLSTSWTLETEEDLKNTNGIDIDTEATQQMSYELQAEIDREMTVRMLFSCLSHDEWSLWSGNLADARWLGERARAFYQHIIKMSLRMRVRNRRGAANFILCTPDVAALLECLDEFIAMPVATNVTTGNAASAAAGTLGGSRFSVYIDDRTPVYNTNDYGQGYDDMFEAKGADEEDFMMPNYCMLGYKGTETYDAGIIYCPYIPIMVQTATDPYSFEPQVGLMTRYGVIDNIFGSWLYYHCIIIDSFSQPGISDESNLVRTLYPAGYAGAGEKAAKSFNYAFPTTGTSSVVTGPENGDQDQETI